MNYFQHHKLRQLLIYGALLIEFANSIFTKQFFLNTILVLIGAIFLSANLSSQTRLVRSIETDRPGFIKEFDGSIYYTTANFNDFSSLVKLDQNGNEIWTCPLSADFVPGDFTKVNNKVILVGRTDVLWGSSTNAVIASVDDLGSSYVQNTINEYNQSNRDAFFRVAKHPTNSSQVIVQGSRLAGGDNVGLFIFDTNLNLIESNEYSSGDAQFWAGLKENQSEISLVGNLGGTTRGCVVNYNPDLTVRNGFQYSNLDFVADYVDRTVDRKIIVGNTSNNIGFIAEIDNDGLPNWSITINESIGIDQIYFDGSFVTSTGVQYRYYVRGRTPDSGFLQKIAVNVNTLGGEVARQGTIVNDYANENNKSSTTSVSILWTKQLSINAVKSTYNTIALFNNQIYALNLFQNLADGFGSDDFTVSVSDNNYNTCITENLNFTQSDFSISPVDIVVTKPDYTLPPAIAKTFLQSIEFDELDICFADECISDTLNISTGYNSIDDEAYPLMTQDGFWILEEACQDNGPVNLGSPAWNIKKHPAWSSPGYNSTYISAFPDPGSNLANINSGDPYTFRRCFCSTQDNAKIEFNINVHVDNQMKFYLYEPDSGTRTFLDEVTNGSSSNNFKGDAEHLTINTMILGAAGQYCIEAELRNDHTGSPMGINISGWVAGNGFITDACCTGQSYVTGYKYRDQDCDGTVSLGDPIVADWIIELLNAEGNVIAKDTTDSNGYYVFPVLEGDYYVREELKTDWQFSTTTNGMTELFHVNANEIVQQDFGNIYEGPLETEPLTSSCAEAGATLTFNWQGKACDCDMTLFYRNCNDDGSDYEAIADVDNSGSYDYELPAHLIGNLEFLLQDCEGNQEAFDGCIEVNDFGLSISSVQTDCGEYGFGFDIDNVNPNSITAVNWSFGVIGSSTQDDPTFTFTEAGSYTIQLEIQTNSGCVLNATYLLDVEYGANDPNCNFCEANVLSEIEQGDLYIYDECFGMIIKSTNGSCFRVKVSDEGMLFTQAIECPQE